ncbi:MAG: cobalt ECF transporter T component CbiQ [Desulfovibrio sp.]
MSAIEEPFAQGDSALHRRDPGLKILAALAFSLPAAMVQDLRASGACLALGTLLALAARLPLAPLLRRLAVVGLFMGFLWIFLPFSVPGEPVLRLGPLTATAEGLRLCLLLTGKSFGIVLGLTALLATMPITALGQALQQLGLPEKLCLLLLFTWRYIAVIRQEYLRQARCVRARGFRPRTSLHTYRTYAWLVGMLLVRSWDRAERVHQAMRCRGFSGRFHSIARFTRTAADWWLLASCLASGAALLALDFAFRWGGI